MHGGARLRLKKLEKEYDPTSKINALRVLDEAVHEGHVVTGLLYLDTGSPT